jgi:hypothetical protein
MRRCKGAWHGAGDLTGRLTAGIYGIIITPTIFGTAWGPPV